VAALDLIVYSSAASGNKERNIVNYIQPYDRNRVSLDKRGRR
jgi:hypothetical protein